MIDTRGGTARIFDFLPDLVPPDGSLLDQSGDRSKLHRRWTRASGLQVRVAQAWTRPIADLQCGECRMLMGQRFGLRWLAAPIACFVRQYPGAECDLFPYDLTVNALSGWRELHAIAPEESVAMLTADYRRLWQELAKEPKHTLVSQAYHGWTEGMSIAAPDQTHDYLSPPHRDPSQP